MRLSVCLSLRRANGSPVAACGSLVDCRCVGLTGCLSLRVIIWLPELAWDELTVVSIWLKTSTREVVNRRPWLLAPLAAFLALFSLGQHRKLDPRLLPLVFLVPFSMCLCCRVHQHCHRRVPALLSLGFCNHIHQEIHRRRTY